MSGREVIWSLHCKCGASFEGATDDPDAVIEVGAFWQQSHSGSGHEPTTKESAEHLRALQEGDISEYDSPE